ncbi:MAG: hypothetical protein PWR10_1791 [Halanaerobiales bacterium]|nr:hypothetical protein [Halanaerobiales bacterium]
MPKNAKGWDETSTSYRYRIRAPDDFQDGSFRTIELQNTDGIKMVVGKLKKGTGSMVTQSLIFPKEKGWTKKKAQKWVKDHPGVANISKNTGGISMGLEPITKWSREFHFKKADKEKRIVYGEVYVPNEKDSHGQWMTAEEIEKMAHRFMENLRLTQIDKQHDWEPDEGIVVESFIARPGDPDFTPGAWVLGTKVLKEETWQAILKGEITGYSMAGVAELIPEQGEEGVKQDG